MDIENLKERIEAGSLDTAILVFPDVFGRLMGKRFTGKFFLDGVLGHGTHGCNYLLTLDMEMEPMEGFQLANWDKGFGDFELRPDLSTIREIPWQEGAFMILCDLFHNGDLYVAEAPRSVLRKQLDQLKKLGLHMEIASELEFFLYKRSYEEAFAMNYHELEPSSDYRIDYHTLQTTQDEPYLRAVRNWMSAARIPVESSKGEWGKGQHEINFIHSDPLSIADMHVVFKQGSKEIAMSQGRSVSFMAKVTHDDAGNSCHIHTSLWKDGENVFWDSNKGGPSKLFRNFLGGLMKYSPELCLFFAPTINSYKRYQAASWAPTKMAWSMDNRTVGFRVVGSEKSFRIENRMPGADANPYLAFAATIAAGLRGIEEELDAGPDYVGNAYKDPKLPALPRTLAEAAELFAGSEMAKSAFGTEVVDFYSHTARLEVKAFQSSVTDWERKRYFERI